MGDIITDQTIHYVVKDYRRMYNTFWSIVELNQSLRDSLDKKEKEVAALKAKVEELKSVIPPPPPKPSGKVKGCMNEIETRANAITNQLRKGIDSLDGIIKNVEELRVFINA